MSKIGLAALVAMACCAGAAGQAAAAEQATTPDALVAAAKRAAGMNFAGTFLRICVAPENLVTRGAGPPPPSAPPPRASWYAQPYKVFDNLYFLGTKVHSSWALKTSAGIIIIDTLFDYASEPEIVGGLAKLGLNPKDIKYVLISHAHGDHDQGAALLQSRYGAKVVMGGPDWDSTVKRPPTAPGGVPKKDISVGPEGRKLTLGDTTVNIFLTPGHTPGTLSYIFPVKDHGRALTVAYSGGTAFNFPPTVAAYTAYEANQKMFAKAAKDAGASVVMSNHTEFDGAYDKARIAQLPRAAGEPHPYEVGVDGVQRYFAMTADCAEAQRLSLK